jgi:phosphoribosylanthranilate isomerase
MNIKVCGIIELKQMQQLDALNVEFVGMDFQSDSPRFIGEKLAKNDIKKADFDFKKVGIFFNPEMIEVLDAIDDYGLDVVQLNGHETTEMCEDLSSEVEVIKAFTIDKNTKDIDALVAPYDAVCDYYLFDTSEDNAGQFDWNILAKAKIEKPFFLSGGIGVDDIAKIKAFKHPDFYGVNVNSKLEKEPGVKDMALVLKFTHGFK